MAFAGHNTRPLPDDQVSVGSYFSEAYTLPCRVEDDARSVASHDSFDSWCPEEDLPSYRVPEEQGVSQPVYEAWILYYSDNQDRVKTTSFCGLTVSTRIKETDPFVSCRTEPYEQAELACMSTEAVQAYMRAHKRCLPARLVRGRAPSYERDLDARIQTLPGPVQSELDALLADRETASSNRFHRRDWTVAMMREQYRYRFASAEYEEVSKKDKKKNKRWWKKNNNNNNNNKRSTAYFFILRGREGRVATDDKGLYRARRHGNPWKRVDEIQRAEKQQARNMRRFGQKTVPGLVNVDYRRVRSPDRSVSPPPPPRRVRVVERDEPETWYLPPYHPPPPPPPPPRHHNPFAPSPHFGGYGMHPAAPRPPPPGPFHYPHPLHPPPPAAFPRVVPYAHPGMHWYPPPPPTSIPSRPMSAFDDIVDRPHPRPPPMSPSSSEPSLLGPSSRYQLPPEAYHSMPPYSGAHPSLLHFAGNVPSFAPPPPPPPPPPPQYTGSSWPSSPPPPAPRLSNLTTPTTFSPATSNHTGSSVDRTEVSTPVDAENLEFREGPPSGALYAHWDVPRAESVITL